MPELSPGQFGDYQVGGHRPTSEGDEWGYFHEADKAYPGIYSGTKYPSYTSKQADAESMHHIVRAKGDPDAKVTMYRAVPGHVDRINPGDWVTASKTFAENHAKSEGGSDWHILSGEAKAHELTHSTDSINELGYFPKKRGK